MYKILTKSSKHVAISKEASWGRGWGQEKRRQNILKGTLPLFLLAVTLCTTNRNIVCTHCLVSALVKVTTAIVLPILLPLSSSVISLS